MGSKDILQNILFNDQLKLLQNEIHRARYIYWGDETAQRSDVTETIDLVFHPKEYCSESTNSICTINGDESKLSVRVYFKPVGWRESDFPLDGFTANAENPTTFTGTINNGEMTLFYYFINKHYVCLLSVDTEYMSKNKEVIATFEQYCLSLGKNYSD